MSGWAGEDRRLATTILLKTSPAVKPENAISGDCGAMPA
jgi:hypothetical protein